MFPDLSTVNTVAYDTETSGLDPHKDFTVGFVLTWGFRPEESRYFPIRHEAGGNLEEKPVINYVRKLLCRSDLRVVMHNAAFDLWMSHKDDIVINGPIEDTGLNDPLINENFASKEGLRSAGYYGNQYLTGYSLESCCSRARVQAKKGQAMYAYLAEKFGMKATKDQMKNFWKLPGDDPMVVEYAEGDGTSALQLWSWQQSQLDQQEQRRVHKVECDLVPVIHRARTRGVPIEENELGKVHKQITEMKDKASEKIGGINPRAPSEVGPFLASIATKGQSDLLPPSLKKAEREAKIAELWESDIIPIPPKTKPSKKFPDGQISYSKHFLKTFSAGQDINAYREIAHLENSFIVPLKEKHLYKGCVYPNFWQLASDDHGTVTGRLSSSDPNMQQVPKRNELLGRIFRRVFVPPKGMVLWEMDYSQCEYRLFAHYAKAVQLIRGYNEEGINMHKMVQTLLGFPDTKEGYGMAKNMNFGILYGMGALALSGHLGVTVSEAKRLKAEYFLRIPEANQFLKKASDRAKRRGYVKTLLGRRRRYVDPVKYSYQAINSICQGGNADIIKMKMVEVDDYLRSSGRGHLAFSVHDALVCYLDPANDTETAAEIKAICKNFTKEEHGFQLRVGMDLDEGSGSNWSVASYGEAA